MENVVAKDVVKQIDFTKKLYSKSKKGNIVPDWTKDNEFGSGAKETLNVTGMAIVRLHTENDDKNTSDIHKTGMAFWLNGVKIAEADSSTSVDRTEDTNTAVIQVKPGDYWQLSSIQGLDPNLSYNEFYMDIYAFV